MGDILSPYIYLLFRQKTNQGEGFHVHEHSQSNQRDTWGRQAVNGNTWGFAHVLWSPVFTRNSERHIRHTPNNLKSGSKLRWLRSGRREILTMHSIGLKHMTMYADWWYNEMPGVHILSDKSVFSQPKPILSGGRSGWLPSSYNLLQWQFSPSCPTKGEGPGLNREQRQRQRRGYGDSAYPYHWPKVW